MPLKSTVRKAQNDKRQGKSTSTQAGEFVHDQIKKIRRGDHGAKSTKQAIAIGLSEARRAGVKLPGSSSKSKRITTPKASQARSVAAKKALKGEPTSTVSKSALSKQAKSAAKKRTAKERQASARKAARTRAEHPQH